VRADRLREMRALKLKIRDWVKERWQLGAPLPGGIERAWMNWEWRPDGEPRVAANPFAASNDLAAVARPSGIVARAPGGKANVMYGGMRFPVEDSEFGALEIVTGDIIEIPQARLEALPAPAAGKRPSADVALVEPNGRTYLVHDGEAKPAYIGFIFDGERLEPAHRRLVPNGTYEKLFPGKPPVEQQNPACTEVVGAYIEARDTVAELTAEIKGADDERTRVRLQAQLTRATNTLKSATDHAKELECALPT
jgi:hypothetical protein